jgi:hypothetical protein
VTVIALDSVFAAPVFDPVRALVYYANASDIRHTLVDGNPILRDGTLPGVDVAALRRRVSEACARLWTLAAERGALPCGCVYPPGSVLRAG